MRKATKKPVAGETTKPAADICKMVGQIAFGVAIAVTAALAWRFWDIDGYLAFIAVAAGAGMAAHACGYEL